MTDQQLSLAPFYKGCDNYQERLVEAIAPLTLEQLALRSSPQNWSVGMLVSHIVATRVWWFHTRMGKGSADLAPLELWDENEVEPLRPATELVTWLERTWQMIQDALAHWTSNDLEQIFPPHGKELWRVRANILSGMYSNTTFIMEANYPQFLAHTVWRQSTWDKCVRCLHDFFIIHQKQCTVACLNQKGVISAI